VFETTRRISVQGPDGDSGFDAFAPRLTYVPSTDRHVVVRGGDTGTVGNSEVFVETVNPVTGLGSLQRQVSDFPAPSTQDALAAGDLSEIGPDTRISSIGPPGSTAFNGKRTIRCLPPGAKRPKRCPD
jgi:hypothetical protein